MDRSARWQHRNNLRFSLRRGVTIEEHWFIKYAGALVALGICSACDEAWFKREIAPKLAAFSLNEIGKATGLSLAAGSLLGQWKSFFQIFDTQLHLFLDRDA